MVTSYVAKKSTQHLRRCVSQTQSIPKSPLNREDLLMCHTSGHINWEINASKHLNAGIILLSKTTVRNSTKNTNETIGEDKENEGSKT